MNADLAAKLDALAASNERRVNLTDDIQVCIRPATLAEAKAACMALTESMSAVALLVASCLPQIRGAIQVQQAKAASGESSAETEQDAADEQSDAAIAAVLPQVLDALDIEKVRAAVQPCCDAELGHPAISAGMELLIYAEWVEVTFATGGLGDFFGRIRGLTDQAIRKAGSKI